LKRFFAKQSNQVSSRELPVKKENKTDQSNVEQCQHTAKKQRQHGGLAIIVLCLSRSNRQRSDERKNRNCCENFHQTAIRTHNERPVIRAHESMFIWNSWDFSTTEDPSAAPTHKQLLL